MVLGRLWSSASLVSDTCAQYTISKQRGKLVSTVFTARDIMRIVDAVEDDGLLKYWGETPIEDKCRLETDSIIISRFFIRHSAGINPCSHVPG